MQNNRGGGVRVSIARGGQTFLWFPRRLLWHRGPTQLRIQDAQVALPEEKWLKCEVDHSPHLGPKLRMSGAKPPLLRILAWWTQKTTVRLTANADGLSQTIPQPIIQSYKPSSPPPGPLFQRNGYFGASSLSLKASARWKRNSPPSNTEVKMHGSVPPLALTPSEWGGSWNAGTMLTAYLQEY